MTSIKQMQIEKNYIKKSNISKLGDGLIVVKIPSGTSNEEVNHIKSELNKFKSKNQNIIITPQDYEFKNYLEREKVLEVIDKYIITDLQGNPMKECKVLWKIKKELG